MEAQRYPDDFDGIIVGSPANFQTHLLSGFIWNEQALLDDPASYIPPSLLRCSARRRSRIVSVRMAASRRTCS